MTMAPEKYGLFLLPFQLVRLTTLAISHRYGSEVYLCLGEDAAQEILHNWVEQFWEEACDEKIPEDRQDAIDKYFNDHPGCEGYDLTNHHNIKHMVGGELSSF